MHDALGLMRFAALALVCLVLSGAADAATQPAWPPTPKPPAEGMRSLLEAAPTPAPLSAYTPAVSFIGDSALGQMDASQCRQSCAHTYFFCLSTEGAGDCPENWTSCLASCSRSSGPLPTGAE